MVGSPYLIFLLLLGYEPEGSDFMDRFDYDRGELTSVETGGMSSIFH